MRLYLFNLILLLCSATAVLVAGTMLSRKEVKKQLAADNSAVVREFAIELNTELSRLDDIYLNDLRDLAALAMPEIGRASCRERV